MEGRFTKYQAGRFFKILARAIMLLSVVCLLFVDAPSTGGADPTKPSNSPGVTTFLNRLWLTEECLYSYNNRFRTLNVYTTEGDYLHTYRFPGAGKLSHVPAYVTTCYDHFYIQINQGGPMYGYGPDGTYRGHMRGGTIYDAAGNQVRSIDIAPEYDVWGFDEYSIFLYDREADIVYHQTEDSLIRTNDTVVPIEKNGYQIRWTTLCAPDGRVIDHSPFYEVFRNAPMVLVILLWVANILLGRISDRLTGKTKDKLKS